MPTRREVYVKPSELNPPISRDTTAFYNSLNDKEKAAFDKYKQQYERGKERAWPSLPQVNYYKGKLVLGDGSHRYRAALAAGASQVLCEMMGDDKEKTNKSQDERITAPGDKLGFILTGRGIYEPGIGTYNRSQAQRRLEELRRQGNTEKANSLELALSKYRGKSIKSLRDKYKGNEDGME